MEGVFGCDSNVVLNLEVDTIDWTYDIVNPSCNGDSNGSITLYPYGGIEPYFFLWSSGGTDSFETGLGDGVHFFTITDSYGCSDSLGALVLDEPDSLILTTELDSNASCFTSSDGGATASANGGTATYTYAWSNSATSASISGVAAGTYSVTITDENGCFDSSSVFVGIFDDIDPVAVTQNIAVYLDELGFASITANDIDNGSADNCGIDSILIDLEIFDCSDIGLNQVLFTVVDSNSNFAEDSAIVTVIDTISPVILCPMDTIVCSDTFFYPDPVAFDNCAGISVMQTSGIPSGTPIPFGITTNIFTVTDSSGNQSTCSFDATRDVQPSIAVAGLDFALCETRSSSLNAEEPNTGTGSWNAIGTANIADLNLHNSSVNNLSIGDNLFIWTVSNGICPSNSDTISIRVDATPSPAEAGSDVELCDRTSYTLNSINPIIGVGYWTSVIPEDAMAFLFHHEQEQALDSSDIASNGDFKFEKMDREKEYTLGFSENIDNSKMQVYNVAKDEKKEIVSADDGSFRVKPLTLLDVEDKPMSDFAANSVQSKLEREKHTVYFDFNSTTISKSEAIGIDKNVKRKDVRIKLAGHTDNVGSGSVNKEISLLRVNAVKSYLVEMGYSTELITVEAFGESQPAESNETADGRAQNRRVEIMILE
ncbi:OmpA family protein [Salibacteraceae bacterium]|nr:OmpA family protein [Salibacteraceae bacterium]